MPVKLKASLYLLFASVALFVVSLYNKKLSEICLQIALILIALLIQYVVDFYLTYPKLMPIIFKSAFIIKRMRISFAYLIRVPVGDDEYLMVKNSRLELFQPPGGVFKCYDKDILHEFGLVDDEHLKKVSKSDLRKMVTTPRVLGSLILWFLSRKNRETDPYREFNEELLDTGILGKDNFSKLNFEYLRTEIVGIEYSKYLKCEELKIFEIYELRPTDTQMQELNSLNRNHDKYKILSRQAIDREGYCQESGQSVPLGDQTKYIFQSRT